MSFANANSKFPRLLTMGDADRDQHGGLAALPDEAPNGASAGDVDVADAPLGTFGVTPLGAIWIKVATSTGNQWAPFLPTSVASSLEFGYNLTFAIQGGAAPTRPTSVTLPFAGEVVDIRTTGNGSTDSGALDVTLAGNSIFLLNGAAIAQAVTVPIVDGNGTGAVGVDQSSFAFSAGDVLQVDTYTAGNGPGALATSPFIYVTVAVGL